MSDLKASLASQIKGTVLTPQDAEYEEKVKRWASNAEKKAAYIVLVESPEDISKAILFATENGLDLAVKGGGHSASGASSTDGGVVVDLSLLNTIRVDPTAKLAYAQGGALWSDFDAATTAHGLVSVGGTINHTGVGGLITGGGFGYLTGQYGLAIDNLVEVTIVTADGRVVKASEKENEDLFWGVRGGGSNFGIVYEFVIKLYPHQGNVFGGFMVYSPDKLSGLVDAFHNLWKQGRNDIYCTIAIAALNPDNIPVAVVVPFRDTPSLEEGKETFKDFFALEPLMDHSGIHPYSFQNAVNNPLMPHGPRTYISGFAYHDLSLPLLEYTLAKYTEYVTHLGEDYVTGAILYEAYPYEKTNSVPFEATAYGNRGEHFNNALAVRWKSAEQDQFVRDWVKEFVKGARALDKGIAESRGKKSCETMAYANIPAPGETLGDAFAGNARRLREVKSKWDPNGRFNKWFPIDVKA